MAKKRGLRPRPIPICDLMRSHPAIAERLRNQERDSGLLGRVRSLLGPGPGTHCLDARVSDGVLVLTLDSPAWTTRVRYLAPDLLARLANPPLAGVRIRTQPEDPLPQRQTPLHLARLAPAVVEHLLAAADGCADAGIGEVFRQIARRQRARAPGGRLDGRAP